MATGFWETHIWHWFRMDELVMIALSLGGAIGVLAARYAWTKRWDLSWKDRWEQRHGKSLEDLRRTKQRNLKHLIIIRWMMFALFFMGLGVGFLPVLGVIKGRRRLPPLLIEVLVALNLTLLLVLLGFIALGELEKYQLRRIDKLLAAKPGASN
jgi:hypothetical protein